MGPLASAPGSDDPRSAFRIRKPAFVEGARSPTPSSPITQQVIWIDGAPAASAPAPRAQCARFVPRGTSQRCQHMAQPLRPGACPGRVPPSLGQPRAGAWGSDRPLHACRGSGPLMTRRWHTGVRIDQGYSSPLSESRSSPPSQTAPPPGQRRSPSLRRRACGPRGSWARR